MIKIVYLLWTLLSSVLITSLSYFYLRNSNLTHGFPFTFAKDLIVNSNFNELIVNNQGVTIIKGSINPWLFALDAFFWWLLFSILLVVIKTYILER